MKGEGGEGAKADTGVEASGRWRARAPGPSGSAPAQLARVEGEARWHGAAGLRRAAASAAVGAGGAAPVAPAAAAELAACNWLGKNKRYLGAAANVKLGAARAPRPQAPTPPPSHPPFPKPPRRGARRGASAPPGLPWPAACQPGAKHARAGGDRWPRAGRLVARDNARNDGKAGCRNWARPRARRGAATGNPRHARGLRPFSSRGKCEAVGGRGWAGGRAPQRVAAAEEEPQQPGGAGCPRRPPWGPRPGAAPPPRRPYAAITHHSMEAN